ncbi:MAG TPA: hypothetical protein PLU72_18720 [Candidatus Ozemobacteraceae bacterium]|nr:hypothetical protein [Candidatus Ozemobacteraceae bacterium]HQG28049.1 hypothetical protein [Candidatus Ozemobacteraceae bacterium]
MLLYAGHSTLEWPHLVCRSYRDVLQRNNVRQSKSQKGMLEDFLDVPLSEGICGFVVSAGGNADFPSEEAEKPFFLSRAARFFRHDDLERFRQSPGAAVEKLVMKSAEAKTVRLFGGTTRLMPFDVGRLDADRCETELKAEVANTTPILVCTKDSMAEFRISFLAS